MTLEEAVTAMNGVISANGGEANHAQIMSVLPTERDKKLLRQATKAGLINARVIVRDGAPVLVYQGGE